MNPAGICIAFMRALWFGLCCLCFCGCHSAPKTDPSVRASSTPSRLGVRVNPIRTEQLSPTLELTGSVTAQYSVNVTSQAGGRVTDVMVELGDSVQRGQALFQVDTINTVRQLAVDRANLNESLARLGMDSPNSRLMPRAEVPNVQKAKSVLDDAYQGYSEYLALREQDLVSDMQLSEQRKNYLSAKADYEDALLQVNQNLAQVRSAQAVMAQHQESISQSVVTSPIDGLIQERLLSPGDSVQPGGASGIVVLGGARYVDLQVPERQLSQVSPGRRLEFVSDAFPARKLSAVVSRLSPVANPRTGTLVVRAQVLPAPTWLVPGLTVRANLQTRNPEDLIMVPEESVLTIAGKSQVFTVREGRIKAIPVSLGVNKGSEIQVRGPLLKADLVVVSDLPAMRDGEAVDILSR